RYVFAGGDDVYAGGIEEASTALHHEIQVALELRLVVDCIVEDPEIAHGFDGEAFLDDAAPGGCAFGQRHHDDILDVAKVGLRLDADLGVPLEPDPPPLVEAESRRRFQEAHLGEAPGTLAYFQGVLDVGQDRGLGDHVACYALETLRDQRLGRRTPVGARQPEADDAVRLTLSARCALHVLDRAGEIQIDDVQLQPLDAQVRELRPQVL